MTFMGGEPKYRDPMSNWFYDQSLPPTKLLSERYYWRSLAELNELGISGRESDDEKDICSIILSDLKYLNEKKT